jgi:hypothetical protein
MKRWVMVVSDKGDTGKSIFSRALADRLRRTSVTTLLVDGDGTVGQLLQFYGARGEDGRLCEQGPERGVMTFAMNGELKDRDAFINLLEYRQAVVVCDLPAGSISFLERLEEELGLFDLITEQGYRMTLVNVLSPYRASTRTVQPMIELGGERADYVVVENGWFGDSQDYILWYGDDSVPISKGKILLEQQHGRMIHMPRLEGRTCALIDAYNLTYSAAREDKRLKIADRSRVHRWLKTMDNEMESVADVLGIPIDPAESVAAEEKMTEAV